jgi:putative membrane protein
MQSSNANPSSYNVWIWVLSIAIPLVVAALFSVKIPGVARLGFLPPIYATINAITAILLILGVYQIRKGNRKNHERFMKTALGCSVLFLVLYMVYHITSDSTPYGGEGLLKYIYYFVLLTHILLSIIIIPFVLITYVRAISGQFYKHRKIARITYPLWLYVAISGVVVYLMISPYY